MNATGTPRGDVPQDNDHKPGLGMVAIRGVPQT